jgi:hypothetical protein
VYVVGLTGRIRAGRWNSPRQRCLSFLRVLCAEGSIGDPLEDTAPILAHSRISLVQHLDPAGFEQPVALLGFVIASQAARSGNHLVYRSVRVPRRPVSSSRCTDCRSGHDWQQHRRRTVEFALPNAGIDAGRYTEPICCVTNRLPSCLTRGQPAPDRCSARLLLTGHHSDVCRH